jgi:O-acetyl-ADP-ribose deacetylase (regulator of RNase III)
MWMITYQQGDVTTAQAGAVIITVNCVGVMGKGNALSAKQRWPECFELYWTDCKAGRFQPGIVRGYKLLDGQLLLLMATKAHWRNPSRLEWIAEGLLRLQTIVVGLSIESLAMPWPGCGNGGLSREQVQPLIEQYLGNIDIPITVYG